MIKIPSEKSFHARVALKLVSLFGLLRVLFKLSPLSPINETDARESTPTSFESKDE